MATIILAVGGFLVGYGAHRVGFRQGVRRGYAMGVTAVLQQRHIRRDHTHPYDHDSDAEGDT